MEFCGPFGHTPFVKHLGNLPYRLLTSLIVLTAALYLYGQETPPQQPAPQPKYRKYHFPVAQAKKPQSTEFIGMRTARELMHKPVEARTGDTLARVNDVVLDPQTGVVLFVVLANGGFAGVGAHLHPVPPSALTEARAKRGVLALDIGPKHWKSAPRMNKSKLDDLKNPEVVQKIYEFYHQPVPAAEHPVNAADPTAKNLLLASGLIGDTVITRHGGEVGHVSDLAMDLKNEKMTSAIIASTRQDTTFTVPLSAFEIDPARNAFVLNEDARSFQQLNAQHVPSTSGKMAESSSEGDFGSSLKQSGAGAFIHPTGN